MLDVNELQFKKFPGGELHITSDWLVNITDLKDDTVICRINNSDDLMKLCLFTDAFTRVMNKTPHTLILPYIPYARQDRVANYGESLSIKVFCNILNSLKYEQVVVLDPHSDVSTALINNVKVIPQCHIFRRYINEDCDLIAPDSGALKKVYQLQKLCNIKNIRTATKHRDTQTGRISHTTLDGVRSSNSCVVVDDICDGGATFVALGEILKKEYEDVTLMITHGIFSKGLEELNKFYNKIICTNSFTKEVDSRVHVIDVKHTI